MVTDPVDAAAQVGARDLHIVSPGERVRIHVLREAPRVEIGRRGQPVTGMVRAIAPDTIYLVPEVSSSELAIPRIMISGVAISLGISREESAVEMGAYGALALMLVAISGPVYREERFGSEWVAAAIGMVAGYAVGSLLGALRPYERWGIAWLPE